ncbi:hypothetical protein BJ508DRAFT_366976 [Ascobolus immersus RN42]|uniref:Uncharacterized protein n=1 Tax=Ascobolus immersus RN42 TaxID=1160509 RepID=A0A3N4HFL8_ASCIM|nr:hypothetical protein BJ508DRAFT_366976 [Ascobolus immersus RN42]
MKFTNTMLVVSSCLTSWAFAQAVPQLPLSESLALPAGLQYTVTPPSGSTLVRLALSHRINYDFLATRWNTAPVTEVVTKLPTTLAARLNVPVSQIGVNAIQRYSGTFVRYGYVSALVYVYVPSSKVTELRSKLPDCQSSLYQPSKSTEFNLSSFQYSAPLEGEIGNWLPATKEAPCSGF